MIGSADLKQYGKLSDIYGRKSTILVSHALFVLGVAIRYVGIAPSDNAQSSGRRRLEVSLRHRFNKSDLAPKLTSSRLEQTHRLIQECEI